MQYCPHCMRPVTGGGSCPHCGGDVSWIGQKGIDLPVGTVLSGGNGLRTYQIGAARGKGGFGITYIARETNSGRRMAIKEYFPTRCAFRGGNGVDVQAMTGQEEFFRNGMNSFLDEGKMLLSQDDLSCVVHVIDYFQANGTAYLVMEYLDGVALHTQMTRMGGRIPVNELMPRLAPLLHDIGQLHRRGVIHRDISPDNIMWMPDGGLKLLDFGSARSMENGKSMTVLMKQGFSPIEQYRSKGQGPYTDIYALAATIYYCVTGVIPPSSMERLDEDALQSPIALGAALTVQQETALLWALSIQPNARPQSMEEFASMLYKEDEPPPRGYPRPPESWPQPEQPFRGYPRPPESQPQPEQPPRIQPQPHTEQSNVYQYSYNGQPAGTYNGQSQQVQTGGRTGGGIGGKNKLIPIGAAAAAVVVLLIVGFLLLNGNKTIDTPDPTSRPGQSAAPTLSAAPTPSLIPTQDIITGVTDDGFYYEIINQDHVVLTGCEADAEFDYMPDDVDGIPITGIAEGAFAGVSTGALVNLPWYLEVIGANAFRDCTDLLYVYAYSDVLTESSSFSGCDNMWSVLVLDDVSTEGWSLPNGIRMFRVGSQTARGTLENFYFGDSMELYGITDEGKAVLMDVPSGLSSLELLEEAKGCPVEWVDAGALARANSTIAIYLPDNCAVDYSVFGQAGWITGIGTFSHMWTLTCDAADAINAARPAGTTSIQPDEALVRAAMTRAEELIELYSADRPNGEDTWSLLKSMDVSYRYARSIRGRNYDSISEMIDYIEESFAAALDEESGHGGEYLERMGMAYSKEDDGQYTWSGYLIIP